MVDAITEGQIDRAPDIIVLQSLSVCPFGLISRLSYSLYKVWAACGGTSRIATPRDYYGLSALYVEACAVIEDERLRYMNSGSE